MRIALASDHAGFSLKSHLLSFIAPQAHQLVDLGCDSMQPVDYPDVAEKVGLALRSGSVERAILICGSGVGAAIAANKINGVRASVCHDTYSAHQGVEHDDMNCLALGARVIGTSLAEELVLAFLGAHFSHEERHRRRAQKVLQLERGEALGSGPLSSSKTPN